MTTMTQLRPRSTHTLFLLLAASILLSSCGKESASDRAEQPAASQPAASVAASGSPSGSHGGDKVDLGSVTVSGYKFQLNRFGEPTPGIETAIEAHLVEGPEGVKLTDLNAYLWIEDDAGNQASAPGKALIEGGALHFHVLPKAGMGKLARVVLRLRSGDTDERATLPLDGHGHEHHDSPHHGVGAAFQDADGRYAGHLELKLHDDKGDLELWLSQDDQMKTPFDVPLDTTIAVEFIDHDGKQVSLAVRNTDQNEDEDGNPNNRDGQTNYFVFPGDSGQDPTWLQGKEFQSIVLVSFSAGGTSYASEELVLVPHSHAEGEDH